MKIGDYVRTKYGISKIISNPNTNKFNIDIFKKDGITLRCVKQKDIIKSSPNIIDLIELGDYVNGSYIYSVVEENKNTGQPRVLFTEEDGVLGNGDIKSIVTKEQIENIEYEVK